MSGHSKRTSPFLFLIVVLFCLLLGFSFTRSSASRSQRNEGTQPDMFVATDADDSASISEGTVTKDDSTNDSQKPEISPTPTPSPVPTKAPAKEKKQSSEISPEASAGVWTPSGSNWMFLVDGTPYTGWLIDTDGHHYYFNSKGIMQTGWLDDNGKRYYLDLDGIMQTGEVTIGKETYQFLEDGSLEGYTAEDAQEKAENEKDHASEEGSDDAGIKEDSSKEKESTGDTPKERKTIALTFDDGPSSFTDRLLDCLEANDAKATFFLVGEEASYFPEQVKRIANLGCEIGNHSYTHKDLTTLDTQGILSEITRTDDLIKELTGNAPTVLRPPYGSINDDVTSSVTTPMFMWSIDTEDWSTLNAQKTIDTVLEQAKDGAIILMHDIYSETVDAAEVIIPKLIEQGYDLVTVHELAKSHGTELKAGIAYSSFTSE